MGCIKGMIVMLTLDDFNEDRWLPNFPFQVPEYDPHLFEMWDPMAQGWKTFRRTPT